MHYGVGDRAQPVEKLELSVGDSVKFEDDRFWWMVKAVTENFAAVTRKVPFQSDDENVMYTVLDWRNGVRGPCDLIGQGFGEGTYDEAECAEMLEGFEYTYETDPNYIEAKRAYEAGETDTCSWPSALDLSVSQRNWVRLRVADIKKKEN